VLVERGEQKKNFWQVDLRKLNMDIDYHPLEEIIQFHVGHVVYMSKEHV